MALSSMSFRVSWGFSGALAGQMLCGDRAIGDLNGLFVNDQKSGVGYGAVFTADTRDRSSRLESLLRTLSEKSALFSRGHREARPRALSSEKPFCRSPIRQKPVTKQLRESVHHRNLESIYFVRIRRPVGVTQGTIELHCIVMQHKYSERRLHN